MLTNNVSISINLQELNLKYDIYCLTKSKKDIYKYVFIDTIMPDYKALSVVYKNNGSLLIMFDKFNSGEREFRENLEKEYEDIRIQKIDILNEEEYKNYFEENGRLLAQLIFNSIKKSIRKENRYNNITGRLYYHIFNVCKEKGEIISFSCFEITLDKGMNLNISQPTFTNIKKMSKKKQKNKAHYVIDSLTNHLRRKTNDDKNLSVYIKGRSDDYNYSNSDFLNINSYEDFRLSKLGVMTQFLEDVNEIFPELIKIHLNTRREMTLLIDEEKKNFSIRQKQPKTELKVIPNDIYQAFLNKYGVIITDEIRTEKSRKIVNDIKDSLNTIFGYKVEEKDLSKSSFNIRIIHNKNYYSSGEKNKLDPHNDKLNNFVVQHITEEIEKNPFKINEKKLNKNNKCPAPLKKIIQELILKNDVKNLKISIVNWKDFKFNEVINFVIKERKSLETDVDDENEQIENIKRITIYYILRVTPDGEMSIETFDESKFDYTEEEKEIIFAFEGNDQEIEGLVFKDYHNIQIISKTSEKPIPNIFSIKNNLKIMKENFDKNILIDSMQTFEKTLGNDVESIQTVRTWREEVSQMSNKIPTKKIKDILNTRTKIAKIYNDYLRRMYNCCIIDGFRSDMMEGEIEFSNLTGIKYEYNDNVLQYCVGYVTKDRSYPRACLIREVKTTGETIDFECYLPLMTVDFIRNGQYTVLPFPFKYLREFICCDDEEIECC